MNDGSEQTITAKNIMSLDTRSWIVQRNDTRILVETDYKV